MVFCYSTPNRLRYLSWHLAGASTLFILHPDEPWGLLEDTERLQTWPVSLTVLLGTSLFLSPCL